MKPLGAVRLLVALTGLAIGMRAGAQTARDSTLRLPRIFADGMVLQRSVPIPVWGWGVPSSEVSATLAGRIQRAMVGSDGLWHLTLPATQAGGPFELVVRGRRGGSQITIHDVLVGDVWVASGQSNMELPVSRANDAAREIASAKDPVLRQFKVPTSWSWAPEIDLTGGSWARADSQHVGNFTAVGYYFARDLRRALGVPIGIINTTWGGSAIEAWLSRSAQWLADSAMTALREHEGAYRVAIRDTLRARLGGLPTVDSGYATSSAAATVDSTRPLWAAPDFDDNLWVTIPVPGPWERAGYAGLDGVAWYRTAFNLTEAEAHQPAQLALGTVDDADITWVNGVEVGRTNGYDVQRLYSIPVGALRVGRNVLTVRVVDGGGNGGIIGNPSELYVEAAGSRRPLAGRWKFKVGVVSIGENGQQINKIPTVLYNRMVHPLLPFPIAGVIWYQGESNANNDAQAAAYRDQFANLIRSWRAEWRSRVRDFPFLWVQLPNYGAIDSVPPQGSAWATLRESQTAALALPRTGQAVTIDVGEAGDLHPRNKQDVGHRLALVALAVAYGRPVEFSGPTYRTHTVREGKVVITFDHVGGGLVTHAPNGRVSGFAIAGDDHRFVWANAAIEGTRVVVWSDEVPKPVAVRYAWGNSPPASSLYNRAGLPAAPFRTDSYQSLISSPGARRR